MHKEKNTDFFCINCGEKTKSLFKKYSETVLKLTECIFNLPLKTSIFPKVWMHKSHRFFKDNERCKEIADKYVEYDIVIIIIDLILLNPMAYRHILLNTDFQHFWKLSVILLLLESYCNWALTSKNVHGLCGKINKTEPSLSDFDMNIEDLKFYIISVNVTLSYLGFVTAMYLSTAVYRRYLVKNFIELPSFSLILKTVTLASTGIFLQLPSIIWDISLYSYYLHFITLYTCLSQLLAYRVIFQSPKVWCLLVIFSSHFFKFAVSSSLSTFFNTMFVK